MFVTIINFITFLNIFNKRATDPTTVQRQKCHLRRMESLKRLALKQKRVADAKNQKPSPQCMAILKHIALNKNAKNTTYLHLTYT